MKRLVSVVIIAILLIGFILLGISDKDIAIAGPSDSSDEVTNPMSKAGTASASGTITITMYTVCDE